MKFTRIATAFAAIALAVTPIAASADSHTMAMKYAVGNMDNLDWVPFGEGGPPMAMLWGDMQTGPHAFLLKVPVGFQNEPHSHDADYRLIVLEGSGKHIVDDESMEGAEVITEGGYWFQPAGQVHTDANAGDAEALVLVIVDGPFSYHPAE